MQSVPCEIQTAVYHIHLSNYFSVLGCTNLSFDQLHVIRLSLSHL